MNVILKKIVFDGNVMFRFFNTLKKRKNTSILKR